jgi:uncharacterized protein (TIGR02246 family)
MRSLGTIARVTLVFTILTTSACNTTRDFNSASTAVNASLAQMGAAANAHDIDKHVGFYAHDASTELIFNGEQIIGWDAIRAKQVEWWNGGKTDVVYTVLAKPDVRAISPELAITTLVMKSRRTATSGDVTEGTFAVSSVWQKRSEGWRVIYSHESTSH